MQVAVFEVPNPSMNQARGSTRGPARKVPRFDKGDAEAAHRRITRNTGSRDPAPDNDDVERFGAQAPADTFPPSRGLSHELSRAFR